MREERRGRELKRGGQRREEKGPKSWKKDERKELVRARGQKQARSAKKTMRI